MRISLEVFAVALKTLSQHKLRSALTMLGVTIGVGSVIVMIGMGQGAGALVRTTIQGLGSNMLLVFSGSTTAGGARTGTGANLTITVEDAKAIARECPSVTMTSYGKRDFSQVVYGNQNWYTTISGVTPEYQLIRNWPLATGTFFTQRDMERGNTVCVLGYKVYMNLFGPERDPVGEEVIIHRVPFRIIGVMGRRGALPGGQDQDDQIFIPFTTAEWKLLGSALVGYASIIFASAISEDAMTEAEQQIRDLLRQRHHLPKDVPDDFTIMNLKDVAEMQAATGKILIKLLGGIASVSLIVGGIGIMNIMLVSVSERTREIGIRMAVGAKRSDVLVQFLIESVVLSCIGGLIGVALGIGSSQLVSLLGHFPMLLSPLVSLIAFGFAVLVGVVFGLYPANKASKLNPIEALRYE
ncbi:MAG TPA: ABC transporter permease [Candidatus Hypogeohydataceae bacterium YC41]